MLRSSRKKGVIVSSSFVLIVSLAMCCVPPTPPSALTFTPAMLVASTTLTLQPTTGEAATPTGSVAASPTAVPTAKAVVVPTPTLLLASPRSAKQLQRIKPEELKALIDGGADIVVVDNQPEAIYKEEHIKGAINFPWEMEITSPGNLPKDKLLILYCGCAHEEDSADVANQLMEFGYKNMKLLEGGWLKWVELGYPVEKKAGGERSREGCEKRK